MRKILPVLALTLGLCGIFGVAEAISGSRYLVAEFSLWNKKTGLEDTVAAIVEPGLMPVRGKIECEYRVGEIRYTFYISQWDGSFYFTAGQGEAGNGLVTHASGNVVWSPDHRSVSLRFGTTKLPAPMMVSLMSITDEGMDGRRDSWRNQQRRGASVVIMNCVTTDESK